MQGLCWETSMRRHVKMKHRVFLKFLKMYFTTGLFLRPLKLTRLGDLSWCKNYSMNRRTQQSVSSRRIWASSTPLRTPPFSEQLLGVPDKRGGDFGNHIEIFDKLFYTRLSADLLLCAHFQPRAATGRTQEFFSSSTCTFPKP